MSSLVSALSESQSSERKRSIRLRCPLIDRVQMFAWRQVAKGQNANGGETRRTGLPCLQLSELSADTGRGLHGRLYSGLYRVVI
jgi:hypothetical protein